MNENSNKKFNHFLSKRNRKLNKKKVNRQQSVRQYIDQKMNYNSNQTN